MPETVTKPVEKPYLSPEDRAVRCAELAFEKKAFDIRALDISRVSSIADCLVIVSGNSEKQNQAIVDNIRKGLKKYGKVHEVEGENDGKWIAMDYGDVLVHVFHHTLRGHYDLDGLWSAAPQIGLPKEVREACREDDF